MRVPPEARGGRFRGEHTTRSLGSRDLKEARKRVAKVYAALQDEFEAEAGRKQRPPIPLALGPTEALPILSVDEVCRMERERLIEGEETHRKEYIWGYLNAPPTSQLALSYDPARVAADHQRRLRDTVSRYRARLVARDFEHEEWFLTYLEKSRAGVVQVRDACLRVQLQAKINAVEELIKRDAGYSEPLVTCNPSAPLLSDYHKAYVQRRGDRLTAERRATIAAVVRDFIAVAGDKPVTSYGKADGSAFVDLLSGLPANWHKIAKLRTRTVTEVPVVAVALGLQPQSPTSIRKKIQLTKAIFDDAAERFDDINVAFPTSALPHSKVANEQRDPFSNDELEVLLGSDLQHPLYWLVWMGLCTGARLNELAQLKNANVRRHGDVPFLFFGPDLRLKAPASVRSVPIHRRLIELGFLDFVEGQTDLLFPKVTQHSSGRYSDALSKKFSYHLRKIGLKRDGLSFHSLRHTFADKLRKAAPRDVLTRERLLGHQEAGIAGRYGGSYDAEANDMELLEERAKFLDTIRF